MGRTSTIFYGPHPCAKCGKQIVRAAAEQGGKEYDQPEGPVYPNTKWVAHRCEAADKKEA